MWSIAFAFSVTVLLARWVSYVNPAFHYNIGGIHIHHYTYGIFILTVAGYLALALKGRRGTFWIALLYGWGMGFTFDEMGMWLNSSIPRGAGWDRAGLILGTLALIVSALLSVLLKKVPAAKETAAASDSSPFAQRTIDLLAAEGED